MLLILAELIAFQEAMTITFTDPGSAITINLSKTEIPWRSPAK